MYITDRYLERTFAQRVKIIGWLFAFISLAILGRILWLQLEEGERLQAKAERQYDQRNNIKLQRGLIVDSEGRLLAVSLPLKSAYAIPAEIENKVKTAQILGYYLKMDPEKVLDKLLQKRSFVWIKRNLTQQESQALTARPIKGIEFVKEYQRYYPHMNLASQLIGFAGTDSKGLEGLEVYFNQHLMASDFTNEAWLPFWDNPSIRQFTGGNLRLTLDARMQNVVEAELEKGIEGMRAKYGVAILMESQTGKVKAMATLPDFNPNRFQDAQQGVFYNKAVSNQYEPGSTFKIITMASALEAKAVDPDEYFHCGDGNYKIGDRVIHDINPYGFLSLEQVIKYSSNICAAKIAEKMPKEYFYSKIKEFGFGEKTGIPLPYEANGTLHHFNDWTEVTHAAISYGHAISATPIQVVAGLNVIATGGIWVQPQLIEEITDTDNNPLPMPAPIQRQVVSKETADLVKGYMVSVISQDGTGRMAQVPGLEIAGKTGTSRKYDEKQRAYSDQLHTSSLVGFFPAANPVYTLLVIVDEPQEAYLGSSSAAVVFREIVKELQPYLNLNQEFTPSPLPKTPLFVQNSETELKRDLNPQQIAQEIKGKSLREALKIAAANGVHLNPQGTGLVVRSEPGRSAKEWTVYLEP